MFKVEDMGDSITKLELVPTLCDFLVNSIGLANRPHNDHATLL